MVRETLVIGLGMHSVEIVQIILPVYAPHIGRNIAQNSHDLMAIR